MVRQNLCRLIIWKKVSNDLEDWSYYGASLEVDFWAKMKVTWFLDRACTDSLPPSHLSTASSTEFRFSIEKIIREHPIDDRRAIAICVVPSFDEPFGQVILSLRSPLWKKKKNWVWRRPVSGDRASLVVLFLSSPFVYCPITALSFNLFTNYFLCLIKLIAYQEVVT